MITYKATAQFTEEEATIFAKQNGWENTPYENENSTISRDDFIKKIVKEKLINILGRSTKEEIKTKHIKQANKDIEQYQQQLEQSITLEHD